MVITEELQFPIIGDNWEEQEQDWRLSWESIILMDKLDQMPKLNTVVKVWNQYTHKRHNTSCTKFAAYNVFATMRDHDGSFAEIDEVEKTSLDMWWPGPGHGRSASQWFDAVRKTLNPKYESKQVSKWKYDIGSDVRKKLLDKHIPCGCSILVDSAYWKDIKDGKVDGTDFGKNYGHADVIQKNPKWDWYMMIDSVWWVKYTLSNDVFDELVASGNIRGYGYVFLPLNIINMPELSTKLPAHVTVGQTTDADEKDIIVARETEVSARLDSGWDVNKLYKTYTGKYAITRMLLDLRSIRGF